MSKYGRTDKVKEKGPNPFLPIVGFILMVGIGGLAYLFAPTVRRYVETNRLAVMGTQILPLTFPDWPDVAVNAAIAFIFFLVFFSIAMFLALALSPQRRSEDDAAKWVEQQVKERKKRRGY